MDQFVTRWINAPAGSHFWLDSLMTGATRFGVPVLVLLVILQWWSRDERRHVRHTCVAAGLSFVIGLWLNQIILLFVHRVRPYDAGVSHLIIGRSSDWSFPSDHVTATVAIGATFLLHGMHRRVNAVIRTVVSGDFRHNSDGGPEPWRYFSGTPLPDRPITFEYDYHRLLRWPLKVWYNDARASNRNVEKHRVFAPYIVGETREPPFPVTLTLGILAPVVLAELVGLNTRGLGPVTK